MELDVTHMMNDADDMPTLSGSAAELGQDAGKITWHNSQAYARDNLLLTGPAALDAARSYFKGFGAWNADEIAAWSDLELNALVVQFVAGSIREMEAYDTPEEYQEADGKLYQGDDGHWYFYMGD